MSYYLPLNSNTAHMPYFNSVACMISWTQWLHEGLNSQHHLVRVSTCFTGVLQVTSPVHLRVSQCLLPQSKNRIPHAFDAVCETKTVNYRKTNFSALPVGTRPWRVDVGSATTWKRVTWHRASSTASQKRQLPSSCIGGAVALAGPAHLTWRAEHISMTGYSSPSPTHAPCRRLFACRRRRVYYFA